MNFKILIFLGLGFLLFLPLSFAYQPPYQISGVDYPESVFVNKEFAISVLVKNFKDYQTSVRLKIWNEELNISEEKTLILKANEEKKEFFLLKINKTGEFRFNIELKGFSLPDKTEVSIISKGYRISLKCPKGIEFGEKVKISGYTSPSTMVSVRDGDLFFLVYSDRSGYFYFKYKPSLGIHNIKANVSGEVSKCSFDVFKPKINVKTEVSPNFLNLEKYKSGTVKIILENFERPRKIEIKVLGVPEDWVYLEKSFTLEKKKEIIAYINPKEYGNYKIDFVFSSNGWIFSRKGLNLYVGPKEVFMSKIKEFNFWNYFQFLLLYQEMILLILVLLGFPALIYAGFKVLRA